MVFALFLTLAALFAACAWSYVTAQQKAGRSDAGLWLKLLPMAVLAALILLTFWGTGTKSGLHWVLLASVLASLLGDHRLAMAGDSALIQGMGAFALAHVGYSLVLFSLAPSVQIVAVAAIGMLAASTFFWLLPHTGTLRGPVIAYVGIISLMGIAAWSVAQPLTTATGALIRGGAALFILSDMILSLQIFRWQSARRVVMLSVLLPYFWGQLALVTSILLALE